MEIKYPTHHNIEAMLLGACLVSVNAKQLVLDQCEKEDFDSVRHKLIFENLSRLAEIQAEIDAISFLSFLNAQGLLEKCGGEVYISQMISSVHSGMNYNYYIEKIKNASQLRSMIHVCTDTMEKASDVNTPSEELLEDIHEKIFKMQEKNIHVVHTSKSLSEKFSEHGSFIEHIHWAMTQQKKGLAPWIGKPSHYKELDKTLGYFKNGAIYYIGARTSMGKTTFIINLITNMFAARPNEAIGLFSLEQPGDIFLTKIAAFMAGIEYTKVEDGLITEEQFERLKECDKVISKFPLYIMDEDGIKISRLKSRARNLKKDKDIKILFVDYLTRARADNKYSSKHLEVNEISKGLQMLARELKIPIVCLAQLNRESAKKGEGNKVPEPTLTAFRESGSIEEDADACLLIHRPDYYDHLDQPGIIKVIVAKNRQRGILKKINFQRDKDSERWEETGKLEDVMKMVDVEENEEEKSRGFMDSTQWGIKKGEKS